ncbi:MAG: ribonuclease HIII [Bacilli bacterium]
MTYAKIKVDQARAEEIRDFYKATEISDPNRPYEYFLVRKTGMEIHAYKNRKEIYTIVFSGSEAVKEEASQFSKSVTVNEVSDHKTTEKAYFDSWDDLSYQIGSDEVGVGDFFGPLVVVASYVTPNDIDFLEQLKINDSKKMTDDYICQVAPTLKRRIKNYIILVSPQKLSALENKKFSIHKTMAKCHNLAQIGLKKKYNLSSEIICYIDQFEPEERYKALVGKDELIDNPLFFHVRGESLYPSVAVSSVIARYTFLKDWEKMEEVFNTRIPKGASSQVDLIYNRLKKEFGQDKLAPYVKTYFRNYRNS